MDMESRRKRSIKSAHKYKKNVKLDEPNEKEVKLDNDEPPTMFEKLPF